MASRSSVRKNSPFPSSSAEISGESSAPFVQKQGYGLLMACTAALFWGLLPILLKIAGNAIDATTIVWIRFCIAFPLLFFILRAKNLNPLQVFRSPPRLAIVCALMIAANYYSFLRGIELTGASQAGVLIQAGPLMLALIGVFVFKEQLSRRQILGLLIALLGFAIFNYDLFQFAPNSKVNFLGTLFILAGALSWAIFSAVQKHLSKTYNPQLVNLISFGVSALLFTALVDWSNFALLTLPLAAVLFTLGLITVAGYCSFGEALKHAPASHVAVIITLYPIITLVVMRILARLQVNWISPEQVSWIGYVSALTALLGVMMVIYKGEKAK